MVVDGPRTRIGAVFNHCAIYCHNHTPSNFRSELSRTPYIIVQHYALYLHQRSAFLFTPFCSGVQVQENVELGRSVAGLAENLRGVREMMMGIEGNMVEMEGGIALPLATRANKTNTGDGDRLPDEDQGRSVEIPSHPSRPGSPGTIRRRSLPGRLISSREAVRPAQYRRHDEAFRRHHDGHEHPPGRFGIGSWYHEARVRG
jgi:hypothetical protein